MTVSRDCSIGRGSAVTPESPPPARGRLMSGPELELLILDELADELDDDDWLELDGEDDEELLALLVLLDDALLAELVLELSELALDVLLLADEVDEL